MLIRMLVTIIALCSLCAPALAWADGDHQGEGAAEATPSAAALEGEPQALSRQYMREGDVFYMEGDYYRAITRYKLFLMHEPFDPQRDELRLKIAWIYNLGEKQAAAAAQLGELIAGRPEHDRLAMWSVLYYGQVAQEAKQASLATRAFERVLLNCDERGTIKGELVGRQPAFGRRFELVSDDDCAELEVYASVGLARHYTALHEFELAIKALEGVPVESHAGVEARKIAAYVKGLDIPQKSPGLAGALSIVPGLGHFYIEEYGAGVAALLWNGVFIYAVTDSILAGRYGQASLLGLVELIWYSGTIFGAVSGAHRFNRDAMRIVEEGLTRDLDGLDDPKPWTARFDVPPTQLKLKLEF